MLLNSRGEKEKKKKEKKKKKKERKKKAPLSVVLRHMGEDCAQIIYNIVLSINYV